MSMDDLIKEALRALATCVTDGELTSQNCTVSVVGKDTLFTLLEDEDLQPFLDAIKVGRLMIM